MKHRFLAFFSGFPNHHFTDEIVNRFRKELTQRDNLVFVSAWPSDYERNDDDCEGMYNMFVECNLPFANHCVIDNRTEALQAAQLISKASCIFLMGGHPELQYELIREKGLDKAICNATAAVLGVSAGSINMAKRSLDTKESLVPYDGLGLADITIKPHFEIDNQQVLSDLLQVSMELPIFATEDYSAIFVSGNEISFTGTVHWVNMGTICPLSQEILSIYNKQ